METVDQSFPFSLKKKKAEFQMWDGGEMTPLPDGGCGTTYSEGLKEKLVEEKENTVFLLRAALLITSESSCQT